MLSVEEIKHRLSYANLSKVARGTGLDTRTIKRFMAGQDTMWSTVEKLQEFFRNA